MDKQEIETKVKKLLAEQLDVSLDEIKPESTLKDLCIDDETAETLKTVKDVVDYIEKHPPTE